MYGLSRPVNMALYFITGNRDKFEEAKSILGDIEQLDIDLSEIQGIDAKEIVKAKLLEAFKVLPIDEDHEFIVEDTSLHLDCLNGLPGPLIKWFLKTIENKGLYKIAEKLGNRGAEAKTVVGYAKSPDRMYFFEGSVKGRIVSPCGVKGFGWDPIFQPEGYLKTFGEMTREEKNDVSMRRIALNKLKEFMQGT
jgi:non-canonical purine NTP pyrophosphatase (RdgB/HAM1 family)